MTTPEHRTEAEPDAVSEEGEGETLAESPTTQPSSEAAPDPASEADESETLAESPTSEPDAEAEPDAAAVAAEAGPSELAAVESADMQATPEEAPTTRRRAPAPAWAWVAILLMALLLVSGLVTLAVARNANPSTPEAVEDVQTLVVELEALNGYLATTNQLMSDAITNAEYMSANVQAKLAGMSAQLGDVEAGVGHARSLLGDQLPEATRSELGTGQEQLQSLQRTLAQESGRLAEQQLAAISRDIVAIGDAVGVVTSQGASRASTIEARIEALEGNQVETDELRIQAAEARAQIAELRAEAAQLRTEAAEQLRTEAEQLRSEAEQLRATVQAQRERAQAFAAQLRELKRAQAALRRLVDRLSSRP